MTEDECTICKVTQSTDSLDSFTEDILRYFRDVYNKEIMPLAIYYMKDGRGKQRPESLILAALIHTDALFALTEIALPNGLALCYGSLSTLKVLYVSAKLALKRNNVPGFDKKVGEKYLEDIVKLMEEVDKEWQEDYKADLLKVVDYFQC